MKYKLVEVIWDDATSENGWITQSSMEEKLSKDVNSCLCSTVGYLIRRNRKEVILAQSLNGEDEIGSTWRIPKGMVKKINNLSGNTPLVA